MTYTGITGITRAIMKDVPLTTIAEYASSARPGELIVDLTDYKLYIGSADGTANEVTGSGGGSPGATGPQGPQGIQGIQGAQGAAGAQGPAGPQGPIGVAGAQGTAGATGAQGAQGETGLQGVQGNDGEPGPAFTLLGNKPNVAALPVTGQSGTGWIVEADGHCYTWNSTTSEWNDVGQIVGPQGVQGPQGIQGAAGATGSQGPQGIQGAAGATGSQGPAGAAGAAGATGTAATISVGTVTAGTIGGTPSITNSGTSSAAVFNFVIPKGEMVVPGIASFAVTGTVVPTTSFYTEVVTASGVTRTLPTPASASGTVINIKNASTGSITVSGSIDNVAATSLTLLASTSLQFQCNGTTWWLI